MRNAPTGLLLSAAHSIFFFAYELKKLRGHYTKGGFNGGIEAFLAIRLPGTGRNENRSVLLSTQVSRHCTKVEFRNAVQKYKHKQVMGAPITCYFS
jgi:hypothetical protein